MGERLGIESGLKHWLNGESGGGSPLPGAAPSDGGTGVASPPGFSTSGLFPSGERLRAVRARAAALLMLAAVLALGVRVALAAYHGATDALVAPIILSQSNDAVVQSKVTLSRLSSERSVLQLRIEQVRLAVAADEHALQLIRKLIPESVRPEPAEGSQEVGARPQARAEHRRANLQVLRAQRLELEAQLQSQARYVAELDRDAQLGLVHKADLERERGRLAQVRVALLENDRDALSGQEQLGTISADQMRAAIEYYKLEAEHRGRVAELAADEVALAQLDVLLKQMRERPIYRATETDLTVAFVPYAQLEGVRADAAVLRCTLWGVFGCSQVGRVSEVLDGEVLSPEPWGAEARGQYALLELSDPTAARARSLRVRGGERQVARAER